MPEYLAGNDIGAGLRESKRAVDLGPLRIRRAALQARLDDLAAIVAGDIEGSQLRRGSGDLCTQIAGIDTALAEAAYTSPLTALALAVDEDTTLEDHWAAASADIGQGDRRIDGAWWCIPPRGARRFVPDLIGIRLH